MKKSKMLKVIATILMLTFMIQLVPFSAIAVEDELPEEFRPEKIINQISTDGITEEFSEAKEIVSEETTKRSENEKHFKLEDGSFVIAQYPDAVHYEDENGNWVDIDNTLIAEEAIDANDFDGYTNKDNDFNVKLAENGKDQLLRIEEDGLSISMKLDEEDAIQSFISVENNNNVATITDDMSVEEKNDQTMQLDKLTSKAEYSDILPGVDIEYTVQSNEIKEYIVVNERQNEYVFSFELELGNLVVRENEDGSISLLTSDGEEKYVIPTPYMFDANEHYSDAVNYSITNLGLGKYTLTVSADEEWINNADIVLPVKIDPSVIKKHTTNTIIDTFVSENKPNEDFNSDVYLRVGYDGTNGTYGKTRSYVRWNLPSRLNGSYVITSAYLNLTQEEYIRSYNPIIEARRVTEQWTETSINWENQPKFSDTDLDYLTVYDTNTTPNIKLDITKAVADMLNTGTNLGIVLKAKNETLLNMAVFNSSANAANKPSIEIYYNNQKGIEQNYSFLPINCGNAGTAYVNTYNGEVSFINDTFVTSTGKTAIDFVYNTYLTYDDEESNDYESTSYVYSKTTVGDYWKSSFQDIIVPISESEYMGDYTRESGTSYGTTYDYGYVYNNSLGTNVFLLPVNTSDDVVHYTDSMGLGYDLYRSGKTYTLTINGIGIKTFKIVNDGTRDNGYITGAQLNDGTMISYNYNFENFYPCEIDSIGIMYSDGNIDSISMFYTTVNQVRYLTKITDGAKTVEFTYGGTQLSSVSDSTRGTTTFTYTLSGKLDTVTAGDGSKLKFRYDSSNERLISIEWKPSNAAPEEVVKTDFIYDSGVTTVHYYGADRIDSTTNATSTDDLFIKFLFDTDGNNVAVYTQNAQQVTHEAVNPNGLKGINHTAINDPNMNYTCYSGDKLISGTNVFDLNTNVESTKNITESNDAYTGDISYKLTLTNASNRAIDYIEKTMTVGIGNHTVTAYVKCLDETNKTVALNVWDYYGGVVDHSNIKELKLSDGWTELSIGFTTTEVDIIDIRITLDETDGCILIDDVMIDNQAITWPVSLNATVSSGFETFWQNDIHWECTNSCFDYVTKNAEYINDLYGPDECYQPENVLFGDYSLAIDGSISKENSVYHIYYNNYNDIGNGFVLSGWGKADSVPTTDPSSRGFELFAYYLYRVRLADGSTETRTVSTAIPFNYQNDEWQFVSQKLNMPTVNDGETMIGVYSITIGALYKGNTGTAYFDNIELIPAES